MYLFGLDAEVLIEAKQAEDPTLEKKNAETLLDTIQSCLTHCTYVYGREVTIHTEHKPLEAIFLKPISLAPAQLQRMLIR